MTSKPTESPVIIDLKVDRNLLNPNFDCYRVAIEPIVTYHQSFKDCVNELKLSDEEYSYLHLSMASQYNHVFDDPFFPQSVYFATNLGQIICVSIELISGNLTKPQNVYTISYFNCSLISVSFPTIDLSVISNSNSMNPVIYLMSTPSRSTSEPWILLSTIELSDYQMNQKFILSGSHSIDLFNNCSQIDFILLFVAKDTESTAPLDTMSTESSFSCHLNWFTITGNLNESNSFSVKRLRQMKGKDWPKYLAFDFIGTPLLCLVSKKDFTFVYDSEKPIIQNNCESIPKSDSKPVYTYEQTLEDICVTFKLPVHLSKNDVFIELKPKTIAVKIKDMIEFEGQLWNTIDANSSVWTLLSQNDFQLLEITVNKAEKGSVWKQFIIGDKNGVEIVNKEMIEEIQQNLSHLTQEVPDIGNNDMSDYDPIGLEECDLSIDSLVFNRYDGNNHSITHRIDLTGSQWLFTIPVQKSDNSDSNELPYFVVRHDVDALVWAPQSSPDINQFKAIHLSTFSAIGYVQASKTNTRFIVASNDFDFVAIADGLRHVYIYRQPVSIKSGEIRNRRTGQEIQKVAKQHVVNLTDCHYIIGIRALRDNIFVLSENKIFLIKL